MSFSETFNSSVAQNVTTNASPPILQYSPNRRNEMVTKSFDALIKTKISREALKWGTINVVLLSILLFDISNKCPFVFSRWFYAEYFVAAVLGLSVIYYFSKYFYILFSFEPIKGTDEQRRLLQFNEGDSSFVVSETPKKEKNERTNPANITALSWHSSMNDSANRSIASPGWSFNRGSPRQQQQSFNQSYGPTNVSWQSHQNASSLNNSTNTQNTSALFSSPYQKCAKDEIITDKNTLQKYLKELSTNEGTLVTDISNEMDRNAMHNSSWNFCSSALNLLKTSLYQMAPTTSISPKKPTSGKDEIGGTFSVTDIDGHSDETKRIFLSGHLTQYIYNIRTWIACTILHRLENEINKINKSFENRGLLDIQIGSIGLDRLKKTAENQQLVSMYAPSLPMVVPFSDMSTNQEYLVQRIRDLAKGCVLAEYKWNSGGSYNGLPWDEHLPTDAAIIFHLFCVYLDSQLRPLPQPGGRPFFNRYVILGDKKTPKEILAEFQLNQTKCAILFTITTSTIPKFNFISNGKIHNCVQDRNNLFYVIVEFLVFMKKHNDGLLQGVNLGVSGINLLSTIGE